MKFLLKIWMPFLASIAVGALIYMIVNWTGLSLTHKLSLAAVITLALHVYEEESFPGGFGYLFNVVKSNSKFPDRYPMNPVIAMTVDVTIMLILFLPAVFFPKIVWLGLAPMFLLLMELATHGGIGIFQWRKKRLPIYTPGMVTAIISFTIAVTYLIIVISNNLANWTDWIFAVFYFIGTMVIGLVIPETKMSSETSKWAFKRNHFLGFYGKYVSLEEVFPDQK